MERDNATHVSPATLRVCVNTAGDGLMAGQVYSSQINTPLVFTDFGRLLLLLDALMDLQNYPQPFQRKRMFRGRAGIVLPEELLDPPTFPMPQVLERQGEMATFDIQVRARQNATWQGRFVPRQGEADTPFLFQSELELIRLVSTYVPCR